jgi:hypothetical protein
MATPTKPNLDLALLAAARAKKAVDDVLQLTDVPGERIQIALMATNALVGVAATIIRDVNNSEGRVVSAQMSQTEAVVRLLDLMREDAEKSQKLLEAIDAMKTLDPWKP